MKNEIEIPSEGKATIYVCVCLDVTSYQYGDVITSTVNYEEWSENPNMDYKGWKLLAEKDIKIKIPKTKIDVNGEIIRMLEKEKEAILARHHMELKTINDNIQNMLAITDES